MIAPTCHSPMNVFINAGNPLCENNNILENNNEIDNSGSPKHSPQDDSIFLISYLVILR
jgi:hypothetical protein